MADDAVNKLDSIESDMVQSRPMTFFEFGAFRREYSRQKIS